MNGEERSDSVTAEELRLAALASCDVMDTLPDPELDEVTAQAARLAQTPIALVSLVDGCRQWFKSRHGLDVAETSRSISFCAHAIASTEPLIIPDARLDARFRDNPLVLGEPRIVFYAGWPLVTQRGFALGTLCVIDHRPRELTDGERAGLALLARQVVLALELRRSVAHASALEREQQAEAELAQLVVHDLKNPLTVIASNASFVKESAALQPNERDALDDVLHAAKRMQTMLMDLLDLGRGSGLAVRRRQLELSPFLGDLVRHARFNREGVTMCVEAPQGVQVSADPDLLARAIENLLDNARRYAPSHSEIAVAVAIVDDDVLISVADAGRGVPAHQRLRVFERYAQLDPDQGRTTRGLGLTFCRLAVEAHGGTIHVEDNAPRGAKFVVRLPRRSAAD